MTDLLTVAMPGALADYIAGTSMIAEPSSEHDDLDRRGREAYTEAEYVKRGRSYALRITAPADVIRLYSEYAELLAAPGVDATPAERRAARTWLTRAAEALAEARARAAEDSEQPPAEAPGQAAAEAGDWPTAWAEAGAAAAESEARLVAERAAGAREDARSHITVAPQYHTDTGGPAHLSEIRIGLREDDDPHGVINGLVIRERLLDFLGVMGKPDSVEYMDDETLRLAIDRTNFIANMARSRIEHMALVARDVRGWSYRQIAAALELDSEGSGAHATARRMVLRTRAEITRMGKWLDASGEHGYAGFGTFLSPEESEQRDIARTVAEAISTYRDATQRSGRVNFHLEFSEDQSPETDVPAFVRAEWETGKAGMRIREYFSPTDS